MTTDLIGRVNVKTISPYIMCLAEAWITSAVIYTCTTFGLLVFFSGVFVQLQSDWNLSCDHRLDYYASSFVNNNNNNNMSDQQERRINNIHGLSPWSG